MAAAAALGCRRNLLARDLRSHSSPHVVGMVSAWATWRQVRLRTELKVPRSTAGPFR
jgi:hypothetical protein